ncbi:putative ABC transport system permease protein [Candidatus Hakubella thermalkaliphila]|uniref:Putative ABC transport system permease protein n=3 Tax=Candidatus Hakubella thermalkaliphila TaxID=2754717 RepID=A0A6V8QCA4_9ACTN|nr:FtsX-like permease family protein [Candidatus Hakubella thermalkaliphila]GFP29108.1 putative ABC transport system permease protein [Candidatus Hakubella thermalkaliphila]GFP37487.1 putative ABC transport system permease protein [Candidatus Hakubella thermalkaliphila]GFP38373.1 putative ABC transport system permease protein [Candidatus Hakubella thermalkaliphila]GFP41674.1 putative ABC transport system permease protein [Candidatus Hakubella thermalkaliphila]
MRPSDLFRMVLTNLKRMRLRTALTAAGVIIGTAAIVTMVGIGSGLQKTTREQFESEATLTQISVFRGSFSRGGPFVSSTEESDALNKKAIDRIKDIEGVEAVVPNINVAIDLQVDGGVSSAYIVGVTEYSLEKLELKEGRKFRLKEMGSIVVGDRVAETFFNPKTEEQIKGIQMLNNLGRLLISQALETGESKSKVMPVKIIGVLERKGTQDDYSSYAPIDLVEKIATIQKNDPRVIEKEGYAYLDVYVESVEKVDEVTREITGLGYTAFSMKQQFSFLNIFFNIIKAIFGSMGAIALLVAALGIINTLVMSIYERFREIGIMKAVGASNDDITKIFLLEAAAIGLVGGIGGILVGWGAGELIDLAAVYYLNTISLEPVEVSLFYVPLWLVFFALTFAVLVGVAAGIYPARRASSLDPLDALRHE